MSLTIVNDIGTSQRKYLKVSRSWVQKYLEISEKYIPSSGIIEEFLETNKI